MRDTANYKGKRKRLNNIFDVGGKTVLVPLDDNLISGPCTGVNNWKEKLHQIELAHPSAVLAYPGTLFQMEDSSISQILNLTASTIRRSHTNKILVNSLEFALKMDADAVAVHVNISSKHESEMLEILGRVSEKCDEYGMPLLAIVYPRSEVMREGGGIFDNDYQQLKIEDNEKYTELVSHCVRIAFEMGADIIKTQYTGNKESFKKVIQSANGCPVIIAGGGIVNIETLYMMVDDAMAVGASGVSIGRNVFGRYDSASTIASIKDIVFNRKSAERVIEECINEGKG